MNNVAKKRIDVELRRSRVPALLLSLSLSLLMVWFVFLTLPSPEVVSASPPTTINSSCGDQSVDANLSTTATVRITKTVEPSIPDVGSNVSICFTISGLGPSQLDVVLAQDVSASMEDPIEANDPRARLEISKDAAKTFVRLLSDLDRIAVVGYSDEAFLAHPLTLTREIITQTIDALTAGGATNIGEGISVSHKELITSPRYVSDTVKSIILLSDGKANRPGNEQVAKAYAYQQAQLAANHNIKIYTIGFGFDADEDLLQDIADLSGGEYFFAPNGDVLETVYLDIAIQLQDLIITDILTPGVQTSCSQWPEGWCTIDSNHITTLTIPIDDSDLISNSIKYCFSATVNLPPNYQGMINLPGSGICYQDASGHTICDEFQNPPVLVGGRMITGQVFYDVDNDGDRDVGELGAPEVLVQIPEVTRVTDGQGFYTFYTSLEPTLPVSIEIPSGYSATTPISHIIPAITGTYSYKDFGLFGDVCALGKVFEDVNANGLDDDEPGLAEVAIVASYGTSTTTDGSGFFTVCAPLNAGPIIITELDPPGYTSTVAYGGVDVQVLDVNTLQIDAPEVGLVYAGNKFGDFLQSGIQTKVYLPVVVCVYPIPDIVNGSFEESWTGWRHDGILAQSVSSSNPYPGAGTHAALLGSQSYVCQDSVPVGSAWMEQDLYVPSTDAPRLKFYYNIFTQDINPYLVEQFDSFDVRVAGTLEFRDAKISGDYGCAPQVNKDLGWRLGEIDLSPYRGQDVTIRFENRNSPDRWFNTWTFVDDVQFVP